MQDGSVGLSASKLFDRSGYGNHAVVTGIAPTKGLYGLVQSWDGVDDTATCGSDSSLDDITYLSVEMWFLRKGYGANNGGRHINKERWYVSCPGSTRLSFTRSANTAGVWLSPTNSILNDQWYHAVVTFDASNINNKPIFYINGEMVATTTTTQSAGSFTSDASDNLYIGNSAGANRTFNGLMGIQRVYKRILTPAEVRASYRADAWRYGLRG